MYIIKSTSNEDGSRPPITSWGNYEIPNGYIECKEELIGDFVRFNGFVNTTIENDIVIALTENTDAREVYILDCEKEKEQSDIKKQIALLKGNLNATDYQAIKFAEGWLSEEEYAPIKEQRQLWRNEINSLESVGG